MGGGQTVLHTYKDFKFDNATVNNKITDHVIQRFPDNPLIVNELVHQIRLYAVVASLEPIVVFMCEEGLVTFDHKLTAALKLKKDLSECNPKVEETMEENDAKKEVKITLGEYWKLIDNQGLKSEEVSLSHNLDKN